MKIDFTHNATRNINFSSIKDVNNQVEKFSEEAANIVNGNKMFPKVRLSTLVKKYVPSTKIENKLILDNPCYGYCFFYDKNADRFVIEKDKIKLCPFSSEKVEYASSIVHELTHALYAKDKDVSKLTILNDLLKRRSVKDIKNIRKKADCVSYFVENSAIAKIFFDNVLLVKSKHVPDIPDLQKELDKRVSNVNEKLLNALNAADTCFEENSYKDVLRLVKNDALNEVEAYNNEILFLKNCKGDKIRNIPLFFVAIYTRLAKLTDNFIPNKYKV